jgi:hypothetical protein
MVVSPFGVPGRSRVGPGRRLFLHAFVLSSSHFAGSCVYSRSERLSSRLERGGFLRFLAGLAGGRACSVTGLATGIASSASEAPLKNAKTIETAAVFLRLDMSLS